MKTKTIFKALALAMLMPTMLLTTACSSEDDTVNNAVNTETVSEKGYAIPVTVNVSREGDASTRATFDDGTNKLSFSTGDKLFVKGSHNVYGGAGPFAGTLTYVSDGTFSGTIYSEGAYSGTAAELLTAATSVTATLLPAGYEGYEFLTVIGDGYSAFLSTVAINAFATSKAAAVEQFSLEQASTYSNGFALAPQNAILNFTITGLTATTELTVSFDDYSNEISGNVTTNGEGTALFAIGVANSTALHKCNMTVGSNAIALTTGFKTLAAGKIYNVSRSVATATGHALSSAVVGDIICSDGMAYNGLYYNYLPTGVTALAKVCYVNGDTHLALAMADEEGQKNQGTAISICDNKTSTITGCSWKLPSSDEYSNMITVAGGYVALRDGFSLVGGTNMLAYRYWSRSQDYYNPGTGLCRDFSSGSTGHTSPSTSCYVRACLTW